MFQYLDIIYTHNVGNIYRLIMSPLRTKGDIVLVWFFLPLPLLLLLPLLLSEACPDHNFLAHLTQSYCHHWASVVHPSVNFSHFNQLLWSHWANLNQTLVEWCLDGPLPKLCPMIPNSNQDGRQAKNRKKEGWNFNCSLPL